MAYNYVAFDQIFSEFRDQFKGDGRIFVQKYTVRKLLISVCTTCKSVDFNAKDTLDYLHTPVPYPDIFSYHWNGMGTRKMSPNF